MGALTAPLFAEDAQAQMARPYAEVTADGSYRYCPERGDCLPAGEDSIGMENAMALVPQPARLRGPSLAGRSAIGMRDYSCTRDDSIGFYLCRGASVPEPAPTRALMPIDITLIVRNQYDVLCLRNPRGQLSRPVRQRLPSCVMCFVNTAGRHSSHDLCYPSSDNGVPMAGEVMNRASAESDGLYLYRTFACGPYAGNMPCTDGTNLRFTPPGHEPLSGDGMPASDHEEDSSSADDGFTFETD